MQEFALFALLALLLLFGPWIGLWILRRRLRNHEARLNESLSTLTQRLFEVESSIRELQRKFRLVDTTAAQQQPIVAPEPAKAEVIERHRIEPISLPRVVASPPQTPPSPPLSVEIPRPAPTLAEEPATSFANAQLSSTIAERIREGGGFEAFLGKNLLNKLGIVLTVIGVAFLISTALQTLGPAGKVLVGYTVSLAMLGAGRS